MPAINPRITITLKPEVHAILRRLSGLTETSQSAIVSDLLETSLPVFQRMAQVLEAAKAAQEGMSADIAGGLARAQTRIETQMGLILDDIDHAYRPILESGGKAPARKRRVAAGSGATAGAPEIAAKSPAEGVSTPISNRGVRSAKTRPVTAGKQAAKRGL